MRLNLLNQTVIVTGALSHAGLTQMNPRFGEAQAVNKDLFKYSMASDPSSNALIARVDLGVLFEGLPLDISHIAFEESLGGDVSQLNGQLGIDPMTAQYPVETSDYELIPESDELGQHFVNWTRMVGIGDLPRAQVDLSVLDDCLIVDARRAVVYKGVVQIKIK
jgi:hypothetical protein